MESSLCSPVAARHRRTRRVGRARIGHLSVYQHDDIAAGRVRPSSRGLYRATDVLNGEAPRRRLPRPPPPAAHLGRTIRATRSCRPPRARRTATKVRRPERAMTRRGRRCRCRPRLRARGAWCEAQPPAGAPEALGSQGLLDRIGGSSPGGGPPGRWDGGLAICRPPRPELVVAPVWEETQWCSPRFACPRIRPARPTTSAGGSRVSRRGKRTSPPGR